MKWVDKCPREDSAAPKLSERIIFASGARSALGKHAAALVCLCIVAVSSGSAEGLKSDAKGVELSEAARTTTRIFRNGVGMTEIERAINSSARGCLTQIEIDGKYFSVSPCPIVDELRVILARASEHEALSSFLIRNFFRCRNTPRETKCRNEFKFIETPRHPLTGQRMNKDIEETFITYVTFGRMKTEHLSPQDIHIRFVRLTKQAPSPVSDQKTSN